jgi:hypothetical protein
MKDEHIEFKKNVFNDGRIEILDGTSQVYHRHSFEGDAVFHNSLVKVRVENPLKVSLQFFNSLEENWTLPFQIHFKNYDNVPCLASLKEVSQTDANIQVILSYNKFAERRPLIIDMNLTAGQPFVTFDVLSKNGIPDEKLIYVEKKCQN